MVKEWIDKFNKQEKTTLKEIEKELEELKEMVMRSGASDYTKTDAKMAARFLPESLRKCDESGFVENLVEGYLSFAVGVNKEITRKAFSLLKKIGMYWAENCM